VRPATPDAPLPRPPAVKAVAGALVTLAYPALVYLALSRGGARAAGLAVVALAAPRALAALRAARREDARHALRVPLTAAALGAGAAAWGEGRFLLATPTLVNLALLAQFGASLRTDTPLVERFARLQVAELSAAERAWCRRVTVAWCAFFAANALAAATLALAAPLAWWALYTGALSYVAVGAMFTAEYVLRARRFRRYGPGLPDRLMARVFPPRSPA
jgi:uncharacterized membrane protein